MPPRPWYLTISASVQRNPALAAFFESCPGSEWHKFQPFHQVAMAPWQLHVTVFAVARLTGWAGSAAEQAGLQLLELLFENCPPQEILADFRGLALCPTEIHCYDSGNAIQFQSADERLEQLRSALKQRLTVPLCQALAAASAHKISTEYLICQDRNSGSHVHSAVTRSVSPSDTSQLRWRRPLNYDRPIDIRCISLIVSDEAMGNPAAYEDEHCLHATWE